MKWSCPDLEVWRILILIRRVLRDLRQRRELDNQCYNKVLSLIQYLELQLEEYEYREALRKWLPTKRIITAIAPAAM